MSEWISVNDRLPEYNTNCVVWIQSINQAMLCKYFKTWTLVSMPEFKEPIITHWIPLPPESPKE